MPEHTVNHAVARSTAIEHLHASMTLLDAAGEELAGAFVAHALDSLDEQAPDRDQVPRTAVP